MSRHAVGELLIFLSLTILYFLGTVSGWWASEVWDRWRHPDRDDPVSAARARLDDPHWHERR